MSHRYPSSPFEIEIQLTSRCNLQCAHCFGSFSSALKTTMSLKHVWRILDDMVERQIPRVTFSGGEPMLHPDLERCIEYAAQRDLDARLLTNGSRITPEVAATLIRCGLQSAAVSIDGDETEHDRNRGSGRYQSALSAIASLRHAGLSSVSVNLLVHAGNYRSIDATIDVLLSAGAKFVICLPLQLFGRARDRMQDRLLTPSQMLELYRRFRARLSGGETGFHTRSTRNAAGRPAAARPTSRCVGALPGGTNKVEHLCRWLLSPLHSSRSAARQLLRGRPRSHLA